MSFELIGTIGVLTGSDIRLSQHLKKVEKHLKNRNSEIAKVEKLLKEKGVEYYFGENEGKKEWKALQHDIELKTIDEFHIKCNKLIVDDDLDNQFWHGINIWISGLQQNEPMIIVETKSSDEKRVWNVSGSEAIDISAYRIAPRPPRDPGLSGLAGESGGNIQIDGTNIKNAANWFIKSNGGNGAKGEDGAKGKDGVDGKPFNENIRKWFDNDIENEFRIRKELNDDFAYSGSDNSYFHWKTENSDGIVFDLYKGKSVSTKFTT